MTKSFISLAEIAAHQFVGNHASDAEAFDAIQVFVADEKNSIADRAEALRIMSDKGMGCGRMEDESDEYVVVAYVCDGF